MGAGAPGDRDRTGRRAGVDRGGRGLSPSRARRLDAERSAGSRARRLALMALFEADFGATPADAAVKRLAHEGDVPAEVLEHARRLVLGVHEHRAELDAKITELAPQIPVNELGRVERAILRSAIYEVLYSAATSGPEAISDAVVLARIYAGDAARRLVNGVLGHASRSSANRRT